MTSSIEHGLQGSEARLAAFESAAPDPSSGVWRWASVVSGVRCLIALLLLFAAACSARSADGLDPEQVTILSTHHGNTTPAGANHNHLLFNQ